MNKKYLFLSGLIIFFMGALTIIALFGNSYAVTVSNSLPTGTFKSNKSSVNEMNLIKDSLGSNPAYNDFLDNFKVQRGFATEDNNSPLYSLMKNLEFPSTSEKFELSDDNPINITNKKLLYIMNHGYNPTNTINNIFTSEKYGAVTDNNIKEYITQIAMWVFLFENQSSFSEYCIETNIDDGINACSFYNTSTKTLLPKDSIRGIINQAGANNDYKYLNYIIDLVDTANNYTYTDASLVNISNTAVGYNYSDDHIVTSVINPAPSTASKMNYLNYSVEIVDPNNYGVYITNTTGVKITNMNDLTGGFKVYIPLKDDITTMDLTSVRISIKGTFLDDTKGYNYRVTSSTNPLLVNKKQRYANQMIAYVPLKYAYTGFNLRNFVKISKVDATNGKEIPGATLVIKKKGTDSEIAKWVSKDEPHYVILDEGTYQLCETIAPDGYELNTECIEFTVESDKIISQKMENKFIPIPDTLATSDILAYIIGILLFAVGGGIIYYSFKVNKISVH